MYIEQTSATPVMYQISFKGRFHQNWASMFGELTVINSQDDGVSHVTTVLAHLPDEAALMGLLNHLYDLGILLVSVACITDYRA